jgi:hypothetical protein
VLGKFRSKFIKKIFSVSGSISTVKLIFCNVHTDKPVAQGKADIDRFACLSRKKIMGLPYR